MGLSSLQGHIIPTDASVWKRAVPVSRVRLKTPRFWAILYLVPSEHSKKLKSVRHIRSSLRNDTCVVALVGAEYGRGNEHGPERS